MDNESLLQSISDMLDEKLEPIKKRLDAVEFKQNSISKNLEDLEIDVKKVEKAIKSDILDISDAIEAFIELYSAN